MSTIQPFNNLGLASPLLTALTELGYEVPTPIQERSIPILMTGQDLLAQAQTGTGKTAAFALPALSHLVLTSKQPQVLVMTPTRELAIQVAEAFQAYAKYLKPFHVTPIYGGQDYQIQLRALKRGSHVIVGTPGRVMDHLRRGTLSLAHLRTIVLDEADEMLNMGFVHDIEWILDKIPHAHQTALFSATISPAIQKIANRYLNNAKKIHIKPKKSSVDTIEQYYLCVEKNQKLAVLTRLLEMEDIQATIIFTRTKNGSNELAEKLSARGYAAAALNGDMNQLSRQKVVHAIKRGTLDIIVATDVAARGIDVDRISHVINFDIPNDTESYIHRIGRTGRAGRKGRALLLISPREYGLLNTVKRAVSSPIKKMSPPSVQQMAEKRSNQLVEQLVSTLEKGHQLAPYRKIVEKVATKSECTMVDLAAALVYLLQQTKPLPEEEIRIIDKPASQQSRRYSAAVKSDKKVRSPSRHKQSPSRRGKLTFSKKRKGGVRRQGS